VLIEKFGGTSGNRDNKLLEFELWTYQAFDKNVYHNKAYFKSETTEQMICANDSGRITWHV
jgi:hypothetical protein